LTSQCTLCRNRDCHRWRQRP